MTVHRFRLPVCGVAALLGATVLTGCQSGGDDAATSAATPSAATSSTARAASPAAPAATTTAPAAATSASAAAPTPGTVVDGATFGRRIEQATRSAKTVRVSMPAPEDPSQSLDADMVFVSPTRTDLSMAFPVENPQDEGFELRMVDGSLYFSNPDPEIDAQWLSADEGTRNPFAQTLVGMMQESARVAPADQSALYAKSRVTAVGPERVAGTQTTRYRVAVPMTVVLDGVEKSYRSTGGLDPELEKELPRLRQQAKGQTLTQDVWVDAQHRPVQAEVATPDLGGPKTEPMTITYSRWGKPVTVERPPADQTQSVDTAWGSEVPPWLE